MSKDDDLRYVERIPTPAEYRALREDAGWPIPPDPVIPDALGNTVLALCVETREGQTVGMARVVGDGGIQLFINDVIVQQEWQNKGIGTRLMELLMARIREHASPATFVGLFAASGREGFYERHGFIVRPNETLGAGMMLSWARSVAQSEQVSAGAKCFAGSFG